MQNNYDWLSGQFPVPSGLEQKTAEGIAQAFSKVQLTMEKTSRIMGNKAHCSAIESRLRKELPWLL
jgi:hypothetical protein